MQKVRNIVLRCLIVFLSVLFTDGGNCLSHVSDDLKIFLTHENCTDFEAPHQHYSFSSGNDEKIVETVTFDFSCQNITTAGRPFNSVNPSADFSGSVWQPPKMI